MNLDKTSKALKRINRLYELVSEMGEASTTEQDLLKAYVVDLYKAVSDGQEMPIAEKPAAVEKPVEVKQAAPTPPPVAEIPIEAEQPVAPVKKAKPVKPDPTPGPSASNNSELGELFQTEQINELSDKLSFSPISDLTKAMGLNERIFTVNELFGGNNEEFQNMMVALNGLGSYDEAKSVLISSVATKYGWSEPGKMKKARNFIKIVQRRYT